MLKLLIVEDDTGLQSQLRWCLDGYEILQAQDRASAMAHMRRHEPELVTLDLGLPPDPANATEGLALLEEILAFNPGVKVIVVTGNDDRENALKAVALGAYDFYIKPVDAELLRLIVDRAARLYELEEENRRLARGGVSSLSGLITRIRACFRSAAWWNAWRPPTRRCCCWVTAAPAKRSWRAPSMT